MVNLAERQPIRDDGATARVTVGKDVGGVEEGRITQAAHGALVGVGAQNAHPEYGLMETHPGQPLHVPPLGVVTDIAHGDEPLREVESNHELELPRLVPNDPDRIDRDVVPACRRDEPDQGQSALVRTPKRDVLRMIRVLPPILVAQEAIRSFRVLVWRDLADGREARSNGHRGGQVGRLSDPTLGIHEGNPSTLKLELGEVFEPQHAAAAMDALVQPADRRRPEALLVLLVDGGILSCPSLGVPHLLAGETALPADAGGG